MMHNVLIYMCLYMADYSKVYQSMIINVTNRSYCQEV